MKLPILQSGFIALNNIGLVQSEPLSESKFIRSVELGKPVDPSGNAFFYNRDVENLYAAFNKDARVIKSFEFREELLKLAISAFGTSSPTEWLSVQLKSPYLTALHRRFLNDTIRYIKDGGNRSVSIENWLAIISPRQATQKDQAVEIDWDFAETRERWTMFDLLSYWTSNPDGFNDLLVFIAIVFSKQCIHTL